MYKDYLDIFIEVANSGSFTKAAEKFYISSTAVMKQMNLMENDIGVKLFIRTHHGVELTEAGKEIYKDAKNIINYSKQAIQNVLKMENKNIIVTVGTSLVCPCKPLMDIWYKINNSFPNYKIKIVPFETNHSETLSTLVYNKTKFDIIVSANDSNSWKKQFNFLKLGHYKYTASMPRTHHLANKKVLDITDFSNETLMMITRGDSKTSNKLREDILKNNKNVTIIPTPFLYDMDQFNKCEENGYILMSLDAWKDVHPGLVTIPLKQDYYIPYGLVYRKDPSQDLKKFINIIENNIT